MIVTYYNVARIYKNQLKCFKISQTKKGAIN